MGTLRFKYGPVFDTNLRVYTVRIKSKPISNPPTFGCDTFRTTHRFELGDARTLANVASRSVDLVVTSPPYPMIEMWDPLFRELNPATGRALDHGKGARAFDLMHSELDRVWAEVVRGLKDGGFACVNIGDAARTLNGTFELYPNHARVIEGMRGLGMSMLPGVLWRKTTNKPNKFLGSGMLPPHAYITLEHEHVLVFRKGRSRRFSQNENARRGQSSYFWEERNSWFSDAWTDVRGTDQRKRTGARTRSAAFPLALPYRLISMYSLQGDVVLDPFSGTGTTTVAAACAGRSSIAVDMDRKIQEEARRRLLQSLPELQGTVEGRLRAHREFLRRSKRPPSTGGPVSHVYGFPVVTQQERHIRFWRPTQVRPGPGNTVEVDYGPSLEE